ncbi:hypothetical protein NC652_032042 [Populus alba x Populus x berolinensis]|nr:hypothetical protein NC652_031466 [Populus alba x Populus x berolinensis]KAJ6885227.1 hypothetical protein NC652_032042 [Populus alba x Populus x berolinensis]
MPVTHRQHTCFSLQGNNRHVEQVTVQHYTNRLVSSTAILFSFSSRRKYSFTCLPLSVASVPPLLGRQREISDLIRISFLKLFKGHH